MAAQDLFRDGDLDRNGRHDFAARLAQLAATRLLGAGLGSGDTGSYAFEITAATDATWSATACPDTSADGPPAGARSFYIDETGVIRASPTCPAGTGDPPIGG